MNEFYVVYFKEYERYDIKGMVDTIEDLSTDITEARKYQTYEEAEEQARNYGDELWVEVHKLTYKIERVKHELLEVD